MWKTHAWLHQFTNKGGLAHTTSLTPPLLKKWNTIVKPGRWAVMYLCTKGLWNCTAVWHYLFFYGTLELSRQCGIIVFSIGLWNCSDSVTLFVSLLDFGTVTTVWHYLFFYGTLILFRQCGIICFSLYSYNICWTWNVIYVIQ